MGKDEEPAENDQTIPLTCCTKAGFVRLEYFLPGLATISQLALDLGGGGIGWEVRYTAASCSVEWKSAREPGGEEGKQCVQAVF